MKIKFLILFLITSSLNLLIAPPKSSAQSLSLSGSVTSCTSSLVSSSVSLQTPEDMCQVIVYQLGYSVQHTNSSGQVVFQTSNPQPLQHDCNPDVCPSVNLTCYSGYVFPGPVTAQETIDPANYPQGRVNIQVSIPYEIRDRDGTIYESETLTWNSVCNFPVTTPTPGPSPTPTPTLPPTQCTPNPACGASGQCLTTQICTSAGICQNDLVACHCDISQGSNCGAGGCPPLYRCQMNQIGSGDCILDPANCGACTDTSGVCGAGGQCNLLQKCVDGVCTDYAYECNPSQDILSPFCYQLVGDPPHTPHGYIYTALGCISYMPKNFTSQILAWGTLMGAGFAFLVLLFAAFQLATSGGSKTKIQASKELVVAALTALVLFGISLTLLNFLGIKVLNLVSLGFRT